MTYMTDDEYVQSGGAKCPVCRSDAIYGSSAEVTSEKIYQECRCGDCGATWVDTFALVGYSELVDPKDVVTPEVPEVGPSDFERSELR